MAYIVIEIQKHADGTVSNLVYAYNDIKQAESKYHAVLSAAAVSTLPCHSAIMVNEEGVPIHYYSYKNEV